MIGLDLCAGAPGQGSAEPAEAEGPGQGEVAGARGAGSATSRAHGRVTLVLMVAHQRHVGKWERALAAVELASNAEAHQLCRQSGSKKECMAERTAEHGSTDRAHVRHAWHNMGALPRVFGPGPHTCTGSTSEQAHGRTDRLYGAIVQADGRTGVRSSMQCEALWDTSHLSSRCRCQYSRLDGKQLSQCCNLSGACDSYVTKSAQLQARIGCMSCALQIADRGQRHGPCPSCQPASVRSCAEVQMHEHAPTYKPMSPWSFKFTTPVLKVPGNAGDHGQTAKRSPACPYACATL